MPSINMIASRRAEKHRLERDMRRLVMIIAAELIVVVLAGGWMCAKLFSANSRIADAEVQISKLEPVVTQIQDYNTKTEELKPKLALLNKAKVSTMRWYNTFDSLTQCMPQYTYLTKVSTGSVADAKKGTTLNINGVSDTQAKVGETMVRLNSIRDFEGVELHFTQLSNSKQESGIEFEIGAVMKSDKPKEGEAQDGESQS